MDNHYHLLIETPDANLKEGIRQLNGVYTQQFNRAHSRVGHLFQGRYKAILVDKDSYLLELCRYIVRYPVRAKMVEEPVQYSWSIYGATAGQKSAPSWLSTNWLMSQLSKKKIDRQSALSTICSRGSGTSIALESIKGTSVVGP